MLHLQIYRYMHVVLFSLTTLYHGDERMDVSDMETLRNTVQELIDCCNMLLEDEENSKCE